MARLEYSAPGVYVEEVNRGSLPIGGVSMSVAGFVGFTEDVRNGATVFEPTLVTSWNQYLDYFAKPGSDGFTDFGAYLPYSVKGWFENGGGRCWVVSVGSQLPNENNNSQKPLDDSFVVVETFGRRPTLGLKIKQDEVANGSLTVHVEPDTPKLPDADSGAKAPFDTGEYFKVTLRRGDRVLEDKDTIKTEEGDQEKSVEAVYRHLTMNKNVAPEAGTFVETALKDSSYVELNVVSGRGLPLARRPADGAYAVTPPLVQYSTEELTYKMYGKREDRTGVQGLFEIDEVTLVACPDIMFAYQKGLIDLDQVHGLMETMITGCENSAPSPAYRMVVLDPPPVRIGQNNDRPIPPDQYRPQDVAKWLNYFDRRSQFAAVYYPWIKVPDSRRGGKPLSIPPSAHMLGLWCQTDENKGLHKAPANIAPKGVVGLSYETNFREQELLNPLGINCIRKFAGRGIQVWGARTLAEASDANSRYISVRRLMSYVARSVELGTQWAVFEPNSQELWGRVRRSVDQFLERLWREGAFQGRVPEEAYFVKCDDEINTPESIRQGRLYIEVGVSPVRPAEFIVFRISQLSPLEDGE